MSPGPTPGLEAAAPATAGLARSSFGPGAWLLGPQARRDLETYYRYCRAVDDCADEHAPAEAARHLDRWRGELTRMRRGEAASPLGRQLQELCRRRGIPLGLLEDLWLGARSDARARVRLRRRADLRRYCYRVAGSVGLACLPIFGLDMRAAGTYALALGEGFQLINILRDLKEDAARGRLYLAGEDLRFFGVREADFLAGRGGAAGERLLWAYARRARQALARAERAAAALPSGPLRPSRLMLRLYGGLLEDMQADGLRVFERRYRLGPWRRAALLARSLGGP